jgi:hypothetical protein
VASTAAEDAADAPKSAASLLAIGFLILNFGATKLSEVPKAAKRPE